MTEQSDEVTPAEHNVAVWLAKNNGMTILWESLDAYQQNAWVDLERRVLPLAS